MLDPDDLDGRVPHLVIIDDLQDTELGQGRGHRTCSFNASYIVLLASARDRRQIMTLGQQMFPNRKNFLMSSFETASSKP